MILRADEEHTIFLKKTGPPVYVYISGFSASIFKKYEWFVNNFKLSIHPRNPHLSIFNRLEMRAVLRSIAIFQVRKKCWVIFHFTQNQDFKHFIVCLKWEVTYNSTRVGVVVVDVVVVVGIFDTILDNFNFNGDGRDQENREESLEGHHSRVPQKSLRIHAEAHGCGDSLGRTPYQVLGIVWAMKLYYFDQ